MEKWPRGGTKLPDQGYQIQNNWVVQRLAQPFILPRLIKLVTGTPGDLVIKNRLPPKWLCNLEKIESYL